MPFQQFQVASKFRLYVTPDQLYLVPFFYDGDFWGLVNNIIWPSPRNLSELQRRIQLASQANFVPAFLDSPAPPIKEILSQAKGFLNVTIQRSGLATIQVYRKKYGLDQTAFQANSSQQKNLDSFTPGSLTSSLLELAQKI